MFRVTRRLIATPLVVAAMVLGLVPAPALAAPFAATASVLPRVTYVDDAIGTLFSFRLRNVGTAPIGSVRIERPGTFWTITGCPAGPHGWTRIASAEYCDYTSAAGDGDDIPPGGLRTFRVRATSGESAGNQSGTWNVLVGPDDEPGSASDVAASARRPSHLSIRAFSFQVTDAIIASSAPTVGSACPAPDKDAQAGGSYLVVACGLNRTTMTHRTRGSYSKLAGSMIAGRGAFIGGEIAPSVTPVVLGVWDDVDITSVVGANKGINVRLGAGSNRNSYWHQFGGYEAEGAPPPDPNDSPELTGGTLALDAISEDPGPPSGIVGTPVSSLVSLGSNVTDPDGPGLGIAIYGGVITGSLWYSTDNGANWTNLGTPSTANSSNALLLSATGGRLYYEPVPDFNGTIAALIDYRAWDQSAGSSGGTFDIDAVGGTTAFSAVNGSASLTISAVNDAPVAVDAGFSMNENTTASFAIPGVLDDASDIDGNALTAALVDGPDHAQPFTLNSDGSFSYTPAANFVGSDSFTWKANDGTADSNVATVSITVLNVGGGGGGGGCLISC